MTNHPDELPAKKSPIGLFIGLFVIGTIVVAVSLFLKAAMEPEVSPEVGKPFPPIEALGWINGPGPSAEDLRGHVVVVDAWAYWCGPCRMATPSIIELHKKYQAQGVIFIGLTSEGLDRESLKKSRDYLESENVLWANGYGATKTLAALDVSGIPQFWVIDGQNRIVYHEGRGWGESILQEMEAAIRKAQK